MLLPRRAAASAFPFNQPGLRYRYLARNAIWDALQLLSLTGKEVLVPAYHHGVEIEVLIAGGVKPIFFRVDEQMSCDFDDATKKITKDTAALYVISYAGFPQDMGAARDLVQSAGIVLIEDCALALLSHNGAKPLGSYGDVSVFCLYKTIPVPNGGALLVGKGMVDRLETLDPVVPPPFSSTFSHLASSVLSNLELRAGPIGAKIREAIRATDRSLVGRAEDKRVWTGTQHFDQSAVGFGMSASSHVVLRNQNWSQIVERRRRNYLLIEDFLRDVAPPVTGELRQGICPLFYPMRTRNKRSAMARLSARGIETVDFWRERHPAVRTGEFPEVDALRENVLELPVHQDLKPADAEHIGSCARELFA